MIISGHLIYKELNQSVSNVQFQCEKSYWLQYCVSVGTILATFLADWPDVWKYVIPSFRSEPDSFQ